MWPTANSTTRQWCLRGTVFLDEIIVDVSGTAVIAAAKMGGALRTKRRADEARQGARLRKRQRAWAGVRSFEHIWEFMEKTPVKRSLAVAG